MASLRSKTDASQVKNTRSVPFWMWLFGQGHAYRSRERLTAMVHSAPYGCFVVKPDNSVTANVAASELLGLMPKFLDDVTRTLSGASAHRLKKALFQRGDAVDNHFDVNCGDRILDFQLRPVDLKDDVACCAWIRDVTEERREKAKRASEIARQSEWLEKLEAVLEHVDVPIWLRDEELDIQWCNQAYADALECTVKDVVTSQRDLAANVRSDDNRAIARRALKTGADAHARRHIIIKGTRRLLDIREMGIPAQGFVIGRAIDITGQEEAQNELKRHIASHASVLEQINTGISIYSPDTRISFYNSAWIDLFELERVWLDTRPTFGEILERMREKRKLQEQADFRKFKQSRLDLFTSLIEPYEELIHRQDGSTLRMLVVPHPLGGLMFATEDVTDRLRLESNYNTMLAVQRETLDNLLEAVAVFGTDGRLKLWNPPFKQMWQLTEEFLKSVPHVNDMLDRTRSLYREDVDWQEQRNILAQGVFNRRASEIRIELRDGRIIDRAVVALPDGAVLVTFLDVTDKARVEQALRERNAALEAADRLKLEFLANISYQLRTPLNAIRGFSEILLKEFFGELNERQKEYAGGVLEASDRLVALIDSILDLSTIEAGYMKLNLEQIDIPDMLHEVEILAAAWASKRRLGIRFSCPKDIGALEGDRRRLAQTLLNLISNAIKFSSPDSDVEVTAEGDDDYIYLKVRDTGEGISPDDQKRIFSAFESAGSARHDKGAGLGLALVKSFVTLHGGKVSMDSEPGIGTCVTCTLPRRHVPKEGVEVQNMKMSLLENATKNG